MSNPKRGKVAPKPPKYVDKIAEEWEKAGRPSGLRIANVQHDDWCKIWDDGECNCNPDVIIRDPEPREK